METKQESVAYARGGQREEKRGKWSSFRDRFPWDTGLVQYILHKSVAHVYLVELQLFYSSLKEIHVVKLWLSQTKNNSFEK